MNAPNSRSKVRWGALQLATIVWAGTWAFWPVLNGGWLWDDDQYVTQNLLLRSRGGLAQIWFAPAGVNYFPLTSTLEWAEWQLWGSRPEGYHAVSLGLHLLGSLLLWRVLHRLGVRLAWLGGLLFAVHPLTVESVAWVSEQKNTLSLPLLLASVCLYLDFDARQEAPASRSIGVPASRTSRPDRWTGVGGAFCLSLASFLAAALAKSTVVMLPVFILLNAWWRRGRIDRSDVRASLPFFALSLCLGSLTIWFETTRSIGMGPAAPEGPFVRLGAAGLAVIFYFLKCLFPLGLIPIYPRWQVTTLAPAGFLAWLAIGIAGLLLWSRRATWSRAALLGLGSFLANLLPVLGLIPMAYLRLSWVADHFAYLPLVPMVGLAAAAFGRFERNGNGRLVGRIALAGLVSALALETRGYAAVFRSPEALWSYTVSKNPGAWSARNDLGVIRLDAGQVSAAVAQLREAVRLRPDYAEARNNLAVALARSGDWTDAIAEYEAALRLKPAYANAWCNLGNALLQTGRISEALSRYQEALRLKPDFPEARYNLGLALRALGREDEARAQFERAQGLDSAAAPLTGKH